MRPGTSASRPRRHQRPGIAFPPFILDAHAARRVDISIDHGRLDTIDHESGKRRVTQSTYFAGAHREPETTRRYIGA